MNFTAFEAAPKISDVYIFACGLSSAICKFLGYDRSMSVLFVFQGCLVPIGLEPWIFGIAPTKDEFVI